MILKIKLCLPNNKIFFKEYEVDSAMSLYRLNDFLTKELDFAPDQMILFTGLSKELKVMSDYGLFDMGYGSIDTINFDKLIKKDERVLHYVFNLKLNLYLIIEVLGEVALRSRTIYPKLISEKGRNPEQFSAQYQDYSQLSEQENIEEEVLEEEQQDLE